MKIIKTRLEAQNLSRDIIKKGEALGFVPTMGALHKGHGALIQKSQSENDKTVVSIFVNPAQFNNSKDFNTYPNRLNEDLEYCKTLGVDFVFAPAVEDVYAKGETIGFTETSVAKEFEGRHRPGHFNGVLLVVLKLFNMLNPARAYFGEKDYQQYLLIKKMAEQFFLNVQIVGVPTSRDDCGLALSSRNYNLSNEGLELAQVMATAFLKTNSKQEFLNKLDLQGVKNLNLEYYGESWGRTLIAHYIEGVRLIDNKPTVATHALNECSGESQHIRGTV